MGAPFLRTKKIVDFVSYIGDFDKMNQDDKFNWEPYFNARMKYLSIAIQ